MEYTSPMYRSVHRRIAVKRYTQFVNNTFACEREALMTWRLHSYLWIVFVLSGIVLLLFGVLRWLSVPVGNLLDWVIGLLSGWWLLVVITVPWNIHFQAREVLDDLHAAEHDKLEVKPDQTAYAQRWRTRSLLIAISLHLISAACLYWLAASGITPIGYVAAMAALLLTLLRPTARGYEYVKARLSNISHVVRYPHDTINQLKTTVADLKLQLEQLDSDKPDSWASQHHAQMQELQNLVARTRSELNDMRTLTMTQHTQLVRDTQQAVAQISADGQFLNHVREIIRFVKEA